MMIMYGLHVNLNTKEIIMELWTFLKEKLKLEDALTEFFWNV